MIAKLSAGDLISQEAVYHAKCLVSLYNKAGRLDQNTEDGDEKIIEGIALAQLVGHIEESRAESVDNIPVFRLAELAEMYSKRLPQLGGDVSSRIHSTDLKDWILANVPELQAHKQGRDVLLVFNDDIGMALKQARARDFDSEAMTLLKATRIIRRDIMNMNTKFNGLLKNKWQQQSVPQSLKDPVEQYV